MDKKWIYFIYQQCDDEVEKWYDGYRLGDIHIYNPKSVAAVIKMLGNGRCVIDPTTFQNEEFLRAINVSGWSGLIRA